jgi:hypothetical protein
MARWNDGVVERFGRWRCFLLLATLEGIEEARVEQGPWFQLLLATGIWRRIISPAEGRGQSDVKVRVCQLVGGVVIVSVRASACGVFSLVEKWNVERLQQRVCHTGVSRSCYYQQFIAAS